MAVSAVFHRLCSINPQNPKCYKTQSVARPYSQFLSSDSLLRLKKQPLLSQVQTRKLRTQKSSSFPVVYAAQSNFFKVLQTAWRIGRDGIEAGANLVPDSVPRPIAKISVAVVVSSISLFVLRSFLSTAFFALATMGLVYFIFLALNKDEGPRRGGGGGGGGGRGGEGDGGDTTSTEDTLEEARRIMEKYK
ncbi:uncharacterized protein LOC112492787 [Ziziphus jujuba]|uniref:Uncharacterized protein LOC112492787 n=1 Tax=Ziziphus jujuba TaxID=326968 RepID=A0ABM3IW75_ZIZJJ|nr:uncharacterized protein LOC112492787 [Ziziphus jujuba]